MREFLQTFLVLAGVTLLVSLFPSKLVGYTSPTTKTQAQSVFAFVFPKGEAYTKMMSRTRTTWQLNARIGLVGMPNLTNAEDLPDMIPTPNYTLSREDVESAPLNLPGCTMLPMLLPPSLAAEEVSLPPPAVQPKDTSLRDPNLLDASRYESLLK